MTALLTADEAARLRPGEQLVIVRPGDIWHDSLICDAAVVEPHTCKAVRAPQDWVALTEPCPTCSGEGILGINLEPPDQGIHWCDSPDCRDGRRLTDFGNGVKAIVVSVEPEPDGRNWRITLEVPE